MKKASRVLTLKETNEIARRIKDRTNTWAKKLESKL